MKILLSDSAPELPGVEAALETIFSSPAFSPEEGIIERLIRIVAEFLLNIGIRIGEDDTLAYVVILLGALVLIGILAAAIIIPIRNMKRGSSLHLEEAAPGRPGNFRDALLVARSAEQRGDYSFAFVYLFIAYLYALSREGYLKLADGKTNRQYLFELKIAGYSELSKFETFAREYAGVRFGHIDPGYDGFLKWKNQFSSLYAEEAEA